MSEVKISKAADGVALLGREIGGKEIRWWWGCDGPSKPVPITPVTHMVAVEPLPDVVPDRGVGLRKAAEALIELYSPLDFTEDRVRLLWADLRAALAAEGDEG